jgi:hypothetical protein
MLRAAPAKAEDFTTGEHLVRRCQSWGIKHPTNGQVDDGNQCLAYIEGFVDGKGPAYKFGCFVGVSYEEMIAAYIEWMRKHPEAMQVHKRLSLDTALSEKFCPYWKAPPAPK